MDFLVSPSVRRSWHFSSWRSGGIESGAADISTRTVTGLGPHTFSNKNFVYITALALEIQKVRMLNFFSLSYGWRSIDGVSAWVRELQRISVVLSRGFRARTSSKVFTLFLSGIAARLSVVRSSEWVVSRHIVATVDRAGVKSKIHPCHSYSFLLNTIHLGRTDTPWFNQ